MFTCSPIHLFTLTNAWGAAPGTTVTVYTGGTGLEVINVAIAVADGERWIAVEHKDWAPATPEVGLKLYWPNGPQSVELTAQADLVASGMYPSIVTWPGAALVHVTIKENRDQTGAQLEVVKIDRDTISTDTPVFAEVVSGTANPTFRHGRNHLAHDTYNSELYTCWTRHDPADPLNDDDDLVAKQKDASTWLLSTLQSVSTAAWPTADDHCELD